MSQITIHLFSSSDADFPFASRTVRSPDTPLVVGESLVLRSDLGTYEKSPTAEVTAIHRALNLKELEVILESKLADEELFDVIALENWTRHRKAKPVDETSFDFGDDD